MRRAARRADASELLAALDELDTPWRGGPWSEPTRQLLRRHETTIRRQLDELAGLAATTLATPERFVLTHGEPHPGNTITTDTGVVLVDWDTALVAPPERDLWMVAGPEQDQRVIDRYTAGTGTAIDPAALATYRLLWDVTDVALYAALLRDEHDDTDDVRESFTNLCRNNEP